MPALALALSLATAAVTVDAPVTSVTVFSDRARVTRAGSVSLAAGDRYELPLLPDSIDPATIRVDASGGEVKRVDIAHVDREEFPADEARKIVEQLEQVDDKIGRVRADRDAAQTISNGVRQVMPATPPSDPQRPPVRLNPTGWSAAYAFVDGAMDKLQQRVRDDNEKLFDLNKQRSELAEKGRLLGGARRRSGWRVTVGLAGSGKARVSLSYFVNNATWTPAYDLQLQSDQKRVQVALSGLVTQSSGEDWTDAQLFLSTAVPATATVFPKILTWKIGEKERFIPTPRPVTETPRPAPRAVPPIVERDDSEVWRTRLAQALGQPVEKQEDDRAKKYDFSDDTIEGSLVRPDGEYAEARPTPSAPPPRSYAPAPRRSMARDEAPAQPSMAPMAEAAAEPEMAKEEAYRGAPMSKSISVSSTSAAIATEGLGLAPPPGYQPPYYAPNLPVSLAGGYDLVFKSVRAESVGSGAEARRVALRSEMWPVSVERRVFPALSHDAYVTAEIKNPSPTALPGGNANLSVGDDPAGTAQLSLMAPGETFVLPLGLDRAIKPIRNVKLVQAEKGIFSKVDLGEYTVTIEVANPYKAPLPLRVLDQIPLTDSKDIEIKLGSTEPAPVAAPDKIKGQLEWRITVPPAGKSTVKFVYTVSRPRGWRLYQ